LKLGCYPDCRVPAQSKKEDAIPIPLKLPIFMGGGAPSAHEVCCVTMYNEKVLNSVQTWLLGFSVMYHYTKFGMASSERVRVVERHFITQLPAWHLK